MKCIMVGYADDHSSDTYRMYDPLSNHVRLTQDIHWAAWMQTNPMEAMKVFEQTLVAPSVFPVFLFWTRFSGPERNSDGIPIIPVKFRFSGVDFFDRNLRTGIPELPEFRRLITYTQCILRADPGYDCCTHSTKGTVEPKLWQQCHSTCRSLPVLREYYGYSST